MPDRAQWGPTEPPPPRERRAPVRWMLFGALALVVGGLAFAAAVVGTLGLLIVGEPHQGRDLAAAVVYGGFGAVVLWVGRRAHRRADPASLAGAAALGRLAPALGGAGLVLGIAAGVWMTVIGLDAAISIDRGYCALFTGPLEPRDRQACRAVARECRHAVRSGPTPTLPRGLDANAVPPPAGLDMPATADRRAVVTCMLERGAELLP